MDVAHNGLAAHSFWAKPSGRLSLLTEIDARTRAFREWITAILAAKQINQTELAKRAGLSHSTLSRAMTNPGYRINFRADTIAKLAQVGGILPPHAIAGLHAAAAHGPGLAEPQATVYTGELAELLPPGQSEWTCHTPVLAPMGLMPGDHFILDQNVKPGFRDMVVIQSYDMQAGTAETLLRVFADGFAYTPNWLVDGTPRIWLDGQNATVMGTIVKSWRART